MPSSVISVTKWDGLSPAIDAVQFEKPTVIDGKNFMIDAKGPISEFGDELLCEQILADPRGFKSFRIGTFVFAFLHDCVVRYDSTNQTYNVVLEFIPPATAFPWSMAHIGDKYYFANIGLYLQYDFGLDQWDSLAGSGSVPADVYAICESNGRCIMLTIDAVGNSSIDDGTDFATSLATGAGFQSLSLIGPGKPIAVKPNPVGYVAFTEGGVALFVYTGATIPFKYKKIETLEFPINPWCVINIGADTNNQATNALGQTVGANSQLIYLTKQGFKSILTDTPAPWHSELGEYLVTDVLAGLDTASYQQIVRLEYTDTKRWLFVSIAETSNQWLYGKAYVLNMFNQKFGSFDRPHYGMGDFDISSGPNSGFNPGYVGNDNLFHRWVVSAHIQQSALGDGEIFWQPQTDPNTTYIGGSLQFRTSARGGSEFPQLPDSIPGVFEFQQFIDGNKAPNPVIAIDESPNEDITTENWNTLTGAEDWNTDTGSEDWATGDYSIGFKTAALEQSKITTYVWALAAPNYAPLGSWVSCGLFNWKDGTVHDQLSTVNGMVAFADRGALWTTEDFNTSTLPNEDWNTASGAEDWGTNFSTVNDFKFAFRSSLDGKTTFQTNYKENIAPTTSADAALFYTFTSTGLFHNFILSAMNDNEFFHLKRADLTGTLAGRL